MTKSSKPLALPTDTHEKQAVRVADFLEPLPHGAINEEIKTACDVSSVSKVISVMRNDLGYIIRRDWRDV